MLEPPSKPGALHASSKELAPGVAVRADGESGSVTTVTESEGSEAKESPTPFVATTVKL
jgi:hypothetical protein